MEHDNQGPQAIAAKNKSSPSKTTSPTSKIDINIISSNAKKSTTTTSNNNDNNTNNTSSSSIIMTAQDRKRTLLKQRKNNPFSNNNSSSNLLSIPMKRRRSLFSAATTTKPPSSSLLSTTTTTTTMTLPISSISTNSLINDTSIRKKIKSSLFNAVMKQNNINTNGNKDNKNEGEEKVTNPSVIAANASICCSPMKQHGYSGINNNSNNTPTTTKKNFLSSPKIGLSSPGGYTLLRVLDSMSPSFHLPPITINNDNEEISSSSNLAGDNSEWKDSPVQSDTVQDWSIKTRMKIDYHPSSIRLDDIPVQDWMYWIFPPPFSQQQQQSSHFLNSNITTKSTNTNNNNFINQTLETITSLHQQQQQPFKNNNLKLSFLECFKNIFFKFITNVDKKMYFYVIPSSNHNSNDQIILFQHNNTNPNQKQQQPEVLLSSVSSIQGKYLLQMKVEYQELDDTKRNEGINNISKTIVLQADPLLGEESNSNIELFHNDLEVLRRESSVLGGNSTTTMQVPQITTSNINALSSTTPFHKDKLYKISGMSNVLSFYEILFNTSFLSLDNNTNNTTIPVPQIICPIITTSSTPMVHMTCQTLQVQKKSINPKNNQSSLDIKGYILPCILNKIIQYIADVLQLDAAATTDSCCTSPDSSSTNTNMKKEKEDPVGSHYFVVHLETLNGSDYSFDSKGELMGYCNKSIIVWDNMRPKSLAYKIDND